MTDTNAARRNMVDCQIHTSGIIRPEILEAFSSAPREKFVPGALRGVAYNDEDLPVGQGRFLLEPAVHARMVQALELKPEDVILDIGSGTGYSSAIFSPMLTTVVALEPDKDMAAKAAKTWQELELCNIAGLEAPLKDGAPAYAPFSAIFVNGAVAEIPKTWLEQLGEGGRLIAVVNPDGRKMGAATLVKRIAGTFSSRVLFNAATPYLGGFSPQPAFKF